LKNILSRPFRSTLDLEDLFQAVQGIPDMTWSKRESEYDDIYIRGTNTRGIKVRIVDDGPVNYVGVYFPTGVDPEHPLMPDVEKATFLDRLARDLQRVDPSSKFVADDWS